jgi:hypothetical protein
MRRALLLLLAALTSCAPVAASSEVGEPEQAITTTSVLSAEEAAFIAAAVEAQRQLDAFLAHVELARASVPPVMRAVRWCEAGRYIDLPYPQTHYAELDHTHVSSASGGYQFLDRTWRDAVAAHFPAAAGLWPRAGLAPDWFQDLVATAVHRAQGTTPWNASAGCWRRR